MKTYYSATGVYAHFVLRRRGGGDDDDGEGATTRCRDLRETEGPRTRALMILDPGNLPDRRRSILKSRHRPSRRDVRLNVRLAFITSSSTVERDEAY